MHAFIPGRELAQAFYVEVVAPLVADVPHSAALLGWGSDVVGFDTERSTDHGWGPRLQLFVADDDVADLRSRIDRGLPDEFRGWPTRFGWDEVPVSRPRDRDDARRVAREAARLRPTPGSHDASSG